MNVETSKCTFRALSLLPAPPGMKAVVNAGSDTLLTEVVALALCEEVEYEPTDSYDNHEFEATGYRPVLPVILDGEGELDVPGTYGSSYRRAAVSFHTAEEQRAAIDRLLREGTLEPLDDGRFRFTDKPHTPLGPLDTKTTTVDLRPVPPRP